MFIEVKHMEELFLITQNRAQHPLFKWQYANIKVDHETQYIIKIMIVIQLFALS